MKMLTELGVSIQQTAALGGSRRCCCSGVVFHDETVAMDAMNPQYINTDSV